MAWNNGFVTRLENAAVKAKSDLRAASRAVQDPRTCWYVRALIVVLLAYAASPIDLIPDFIPILGLLDDLVFLSFGLALVVWLLPPGVLDAHRAEVLADASPGWPRLGLAIVVAVWLASAGLILILFRDRL